MSFCGYTSSKRKTKESMSLWTGWTGNLVIRNTGTDKVPDAVLVSLFTGINVSMPKEDLEEKGTHN